MLRHFGREGSALLPTIKDAIRNLGLRRRTGLSLSVRRSPSTRCPESARGIYLAWGVQATRTTPSRAVSRWTASGTFVS